MANRDQVQVDSPVAYFRKLLRDRSAEIAQPAELVSSVPALAQAAVQGAIDSKPEQPDPEAGRAMAAFEALPPADRARTLERFAETLKGALKKTYDIQGLGSPMIRGSLAGWLARGG
jgi:hypothetical protein